MFSCNPHDPGYEYNYYVSVESKNNATRTKFPRIDSSSVKESNFVLTMECVTKVAGAGISVSMDRSETLPVISEQ